MHFFRAIQIGVTPVQKRELKMILGRTTYPVYIASWGDLTPLDRSNTQHVNIVSVFCWTNK